MALEQCWHNTELLGRSSMRVIGIDGDTYIHECELCGYKTGNTFVERAFNSSAFDVLAEAVERLPKVPQLTMDEIGTRVRNWLGVK